MRLKSILGAMAAIMALALSSPKPVEASECYRCARADGFGHTRVVRHHAYYPRYAHVYAAHSGTVATIIATAARLLSLLQLGLLGAAVGLSP